MKNVTTFRLPLQLVISSIALWLTLNTTNPADSGVVGVILVLVLAYIVVQSVLEIGLRALRRLRGVPKHPFYVAFGYAIVPIVIIGLQTVQQLTALDIILALLAVIVVHFYITRKA